VPNEVSVGCDDADNVSRSIQMPLALYMCFCHAGAMLTQFQSNKTEMRK
jgi:hypothetical protein